MSPRYERHGARGPGGGNDRAAARQTRQYDARQARAMARDPLRGPVPRPPGTPMSEDTCVCRHREDAHEDSWVAPCLTTRCRCLAFDPAPMP